MGTFWGPFEVALVAKWGSRAVVLEVEILMTKKVVRELATLGGTWQHLARLGGNLGAWP